MTADDWRALPHLTAAVPRQTSGCQPIDADPANAGIRREARGSAGRTRTPMAC